MVLVKVLVCCALQQRVALASLLGYGNGVAAVGLGQHVELAVMLVEQAFLRCAAEVEPAMSLKGQLAGAFVEHGLEQCVAVEGGHGCAVGGEVGGL